jgi:hypothetical protein
LSDAHIIFSEMHSLKYEEVLVKLSSYVSYSMKFANGVIIFY